MAVSAQNLANGGFAMFTTTSLSVSKMSTERTYVVVDSGSSQSLPQKASRAGSVLNSRKGSHLMSDIVLSPFRSSLVAASAYRYAFGIPRTYVAAPRPERLIYRGFLSDEEKIADCLDASFSHIVPFSALDAEADRRI